MSIPPTTLTGRNLTLRPYGRDDAAALCEAALESMATVGLWMPWCHRDYTIRDSHEWLERCEAAWPSGTEYAFAMIDPRGRLVGSAGINQINRVNNFANLGYWVRETEQGKGYAVEGARLVAGFAFRTLHLGRVEIVAAVDNIASRSVAERVGATFECIARNRVVVRDVAMSAAIYSLVDGHAVAAP